MGTSTPTLSDLAPIVQQELYNSASISATGTSDHDCVNGTDEFIAGFSGYGYAFTDQFPSAHTRHAFGNFTVQSMCKSDLNIVNACIGGSQASPSRYAELLDVDQIDAIFEYAYSGYSTDGSIDFVNGKPVVRARY